MVPKGKQADYIGKDVLERTRELVNSGNPPFTHQLVGLKLDGKPIEDYALDFWLVGPNAGSEPCGWITSLWYSPELGNQHRRHSLCAGRLGGARHLTGDLTAIRLSRHPRATSRRHRLRDALPRIGQPQLAGTRQVRRPRLRILIGEAKMKEVKKTARHEGAVLAIHHCTTSVTSSATIAQRNCRLWQHTIPL